MTKYAGYIFLVLIAFGCKKKTQWTETIDSVVKCRATIDTYEFVSNKQFVMNHILVDVDGLTITGDRIQADDISLSTSTYSKFDFIPGTTTANYSFDIPQGTYNSMSVTVNVNNDSNNSVFVIGKYYVTNGDIYDIKISMDVDGLQLVPVHDSDNSSTVLIEEGVNKNLVLTFDPEILYSDVIGGQFHSAVMSTGNVNDTFFIDNSHNQSLYLAMLGKFDEALSARFE